MNGSSARVDASLIAAQLAERIEQLATHLVGASPSFRHGNEVRYYPKGGLVVTVSGPKRGVWCNHGAGSVGGDALALVMHLRQCSFAEALAWSVAWLGVAPGDLTIDQTAVRPRSQASSDTGPTKSTTDQARRIWVETVDPAGTPVEIYLASRGLRLEAGAPFRFHAQCPRGSNERVAAMVSLMTDPFTCEPVGVHRTFLLPDGSGKADGKSKMMLGRAGVIRLMPDEEAGLGLGLAEGIETALSVMQHFDWRPVWATGSSGGIEKFPVLPGIECVTIFADADGSGFSAGEQCKAKWEEAGRQANIIAPPNGEDFNDSAIRCAS